VNPFKRFPFKRFKTPLAVLILGVASVGLLVFTNRIHERLHLYFLYDDMIHEIEISLLKAHLAMEGINHKDVHADMEDERTNLDMALYTVDAMLSGGITYHGKMVPVLRDRDLRKEVEAIRPLITELQKVAESGHISGIESSQDQHYERVFIDVIDKTDQIINSFEDSLHNYEKQLQTLFVGVLIIWTVILSISVLGLLILTSRRNRAENMLRKSEEHFRSVADTANDAVITIDSNGLIVYWNWAAGDIFGYSADEVNGKPVTIIVSKHAGKKHIQGIIKAESRDESRLTEKPVERIGLKKDGSEVPIEITLSKWSAGREVFFTGIIRDITERKRMNDLLQMSRDRYRSVVDEQSDLVCRWQGEGVLTFVNDAFCMYFGMERTDLVGRDFLSFVQDQERDKVRKYIVALSKESPVVSYENQVVLPGGEMRWQYWITRVFFDRSSNIEEYQSVGQDITERKHTEEELKRHRERLEEIVEERTSELKKNYAKLQKEINERKHAEEQTKSMALFAELSPSPVLRFDADGNVIMANPAAQEMLDSDYLIGRSLGSIIPGMEHIDLSRCIREGNICSHAAKIKNRYFHFTLRWLPDQNAGQIYGSDITEQRKAEAETVRASQLASLGELAAGVAHEINNPINGIINFAQMMVDTLKDGSKESAIAKQIIHEGDRIAGIVASLLSFARQEESEKSPVFIEEILSECISLLNAQLKKERIRIDLDVPTDLPPVIAHFQKVEQVFLNVINNARYAINQKYADKHHDKVINVAVSSVNKENKPYVRITFIDRGIGIPHNLLDKIMNPFFSTKPKGTGTGLGLSISHGIITNHGGTFDIESSEGKFTKIIIDLPCKIRRQHERKRTDQSHSGMKAKG